MNVTHDFGSTTGNGELQVRGTSVNDFGDAEHIPYDIRQGKITPKDTEYATVYSAIKNMDKNSYTRYNEYLSATYDYLRLQELGITVIKPELTGEFKTITGEILSQEQLDMLSMEGLTALYRKIHPPK